MVPKITPRASWKQSDFKLCPLLEAKTKQRALTLELKPVGLREKQNHRTIQKQIL